MESERKGRGWHIVPSIWLALALIFAFSAGACFAMGSLWWIVAAVLCVSYGFLSIRSVIRLQKNMRFLMEATLSEDFAYKFSTEGKNTEERETYDLLNRIVEHLELLTNEVRQNEAFLSKVLNLTEIGVAVADSHGNIRLYNEAALKLLERTVLTHVCQLAETPYHDIKVKKQPLTVGDKTFTVYSFSDLSRPIQQTEVESWEKLTRVLTHEIMNSLTPIQSIAETMSNKGSVAEMTEAFNTISSSSSSLMQFVKNFREFSKLPEPQMRVLYLKPLLESCVRAGESYIKGKKIVIKLFCFPPDVMVYTDESLLTRVILNIIKNAIEADPRSIVIETYVKADETVEIRISNDGDLISDETAEHMFTPFFTTRETGSGIGLSLSRRIIAHLGGTLSFKTKPNTCFAIRL